jgi:Sigma-70, region 4
VKCRGKLQDPSFKLRLWDPEKACLHNELQQILAEVIQKLDPKSPIIFTLRDVEKFTIEETAKLLGLSIPVVKMRLLRSRLKLREELTKYFGKDVRNARGSLIGSESHDGVGRKGFHVHLDSHRSLALWSGKLPNAGYLQNQLDSHQSLNRQWFGYVEKVLS